MSHTRATLITTAACWLLVPSSVRAELPETPRVVVTSADGGTSLRLQLAAQLRLELADRDAGPGQEREQEATAFFRRIRPVARGTLLTEDLTYLVHLNLVPGSLELDDLYVGYAFHPQAQLLLGQAKIPFTRYRINSFKDTPLADWSNETIYFGAERQVGLTLHNGLERPAQWEYQLGVYTGVNARGSNAVGMARTFGEPRPNPSHLVDPAPPAELHPEVVLHLGHNHGGINPRRPTDLEGGPPRFMVGASAAWDARPTPAQDMSLRLAPEALLKAYGFSLNGVFYLGFWEEREHAIETTTLGFVGFVVQASQLLLDRLEVAARYTLVHTTADIREAARTRADEQVAAADPADATELAHQYRSVGRVTDEHDAGIGLNVYLHGTMVVWKTDLSALLHVRTDADRMDRRIRSQLQLAF